MGTTAASLHARCAYGCAAAGPPCATADGYEGWLVAELQKAIELPDVAKLQELTNVVPGVRDKSFSFAGEEFPMTALALALQRRDQRPVRALLEAGVSPNLPISEEQRAVYAHRSQLAALNGGDPDVQNLVPNTHFEALCALQHKDLFMLLLERSANPNTGMIQVCHCGDGEMLEALLSRCGEPNSWLRRSTPLASAVKSKLQPYEKAVSLLKAAADPNFMGPPAAAAGTGPAPHPPLTTATRKRDYRMVKLLLEAGADVNQAAGDEGLPTPLFWATYWGEVELIKLFVASSKHRLDLGLRKYTNETVLDVAQTSRSFAALRKPRHIVKLPLPNRPPVVYEKISKILEEYRDQYPEAGGPSPHALIGGPLTGSTTATRRGEGAVGSQESLA